MSLDETLFRLGNQAAANAVGDAVMPVITANGVMLPIYGALLALALWRSWATPTLRTQTLVMIAALLVAVVIVDQSIIVIKDVVLRERPCRALSGVRLLVECGTGKSFPSAHAANNAAAAVILATLYHRLRWYALGWALLVGYSRVYCGVHYPLDVLAGAGWGAAVAFGVLGARTHGLRLLDRFTGTAAQSIAEKIMRQNTRQSTRQTAPQHGNSTDDTDTKR
jgi:membrane-associated phospholipid phosphatase